MTFDTRYVKCDRPTVITGGELSLDMLDLVYNPTARTYQAPLQLSPLAASLSSTIWAAKKNRPKP